MSRPRTCPSPCNVLLVGGGGREHALAWKLRQSPRLGRLWLTDQANAGLQAIGEPCPVPMDGSNVFRMQRWCDTEGIDLVVVGPEAPLAAGLADALRTDRRAVFGPDRDGARIEADKAFAKKLMRQAAVPTAEGRVFDHAEAALGYVQTREDGCVVKACGLAAGKGVVVCDTVPEAESAVDRIMVQREFSEAGDTVLVEEKLDGQEASVLALVDGRTIWLLDPCQDHKQVGEGDTGANAGGMRAYHPTTVIDGPTLDSIERGIFVPIVDALRRESICLSSTAASATRSASP
ncbi:MAG: phosphoribosylamine--glycine ligase [Planctomycetota bacterium]|jgi:phosphoribosylamine--glycine ligase